MLQRPCWELRREQLVRVDGAPPKCVITLFHAADFGHMSILPAVHCVQLFSAAAAKRHLESKTTNSYCRSVLCYFLSHLCSHKY